MEQTIEKIIPIPSLGGTIDINLKSDVQTYGFTGTVSLSGPISIAPTGTPAEGMVVNMFFKSAVTLGAQTFTIFGKTIYKETLLKPFQAVATYINGSWWVFINSSWAEAGVVNGIHLDPGVVDNSTIEISSDVVRVKDAGITAAKLATDAVETAKIKAKNVTLAKIQDITRGSILVGGTADAPSLLDAKTSGYILIGDGTDAKSVAVSGDVTITSAGVVSIGANKITLAMIANDLLTNAKINSSAAIAFTKMAALTATKIPVINSSGFIEAGNTTPTELDTLHSVTAGVAQANKALVLGASKTIDEINITALKIGGTALTKTAEQLNDNAASVKSYNTHSNLDEAYDLHMVDTSGGNVTITLPSLASAKKKVHTFKKTSAANTLTIATSGTDNLNKMDLSDATSTTVTGGSYFTKIANATTEWQEFV